MNPTSSLPAPATLASEAPPAETSHPLRTRIVLVLLGLLGLVLSLAASWLRPDQSDVFQLWAMIGLAAAAIPVLLDSLTSLKADGFEATKYYMDQFVALAILACFATGQYITGTIVAVILIVGQMLEEHATLGVEEAVNALVKLTRVQARRIDANQAPTLVDASALRTGDVIMVLPGDTIPADAVVLTGSSSVDQALITGESLPVDCGPDGTVYAGSTNLSGQLTLRVLHVGSGTVIGRVRQIVEEAKGSRAPVMRLIDRYTRYYMPLVLITAGFVLFFTHDVQRAISVIIVSMPCAFVLASPSAMVPALAVASRLGILVKSARHFEVAARIDAIAFDKTGTLTTGQLRVTELQPAQDHGEDILLRLAAELGQSSTHPLAQAVVTAARERGLPLRPPLPGVEEVPGQGLRSGSLLAGRPDWLLAQGITVPSGHLAAGSGSALFVADATGFVGAIHFTDTIRPEARAAIQALRRHGVADFVMLTGDRAVAAQSIAAEAGISHYRAACLPDEKRDEVQHIRSSGRQVLVLGDGVNDAPALAAGDLGVAMGALGSDIAIKTSDVALMGSDLRLLPRFIALSRRTLQLVNQNLIWGSGFILLFVILSASGFVSPIVAAGLHEFSAFFVILNSARLLRFDETEA